LKEVIDVDAYHIRPVSKGVWDIKHSAQQHCTRWALKRFHWEQYGGVCDEIPQGLFVERQCQDHSLIFTAEGGQVVDAVFVVGVVSFQQQMKAMIWKKNVISVHIWLTDLSEKKWTLKRMWNMLKCESRVELSGQKLMIQLYHNIVISISRKFMHQLTVFHKDKGDEKKEKKWNEKSMTMAIADAQTGHTLHIAGMIYMWAIMKQAKAVTDKRQQFQALSMNWHQFLCFQSTVKRQQQAAGSKKCKWALFEAEAKKKRMNRWVWLWKMNVKVQLKQMMNKEAVFQGVQKEVIKAITVEKSPIVMMMLMNAGKSMLFMLLMWAEQGRMTMVIVSLIALCRNMKWHCNVLRISCAEWEGQCPPNAAAIVLVMLKSAVSKGFMTFLNWLKATQQLNQIVIDECHIVLNCQYTFHKQMQQLRRLMMTKTQMMLLMTMLLLSKEKKLYRRMYFKKEQVKKFRARTVRVNVTYQVIDISRVKRQGNKKKMVLRLIDKQFQRYVMRKVMVYCNTVSKVKRIAEGFDCNAYHHYAIEKNSMLKDFRKERQQMIVTTSVRNGCWHTEHQVYCTRELTTNVVELCAREWKNRTRQKKSEVIVIEDDDEKAWKNNSDQTEEKKKLMQRYIWGKSDMAICRRVMLNEYLNERKNQIRCEEKKELCNICDRGKELKDEEMKKETVKKRMKEKETVEKRMKEKEIVKKRIEEKEIMKRQKKIKQVKKVQHEFWQQECKRREWQEEFSRSKQQKYLKMKWLRQQLQKLLKDLES